MELVVEMHLYHTGSQSALTGKQNSQVKRDTAYIYAIQYIGMKKAALLRELVAGHGYGNSMKQAANGRIRQ